MCVYVYSTCVRLTDSRPKRCKQCKCFQTLPWQPNSVLPHQVPGDECITLQNRARTHTHTLRWHLVYSCLRSSKMVGSTNRDCILLAELTWRTTSSIHVLFIWKDFRIVCFHGVLCTKLITAQCENDGRCISYSVINLSNHGRIGLWIRDRWRNTKLN